MSAILQCHFKIGRNTPFYIIQFFKLMMMVVSDQSTAHAIKLIMTSDQRMRTVKLMMMSDQYMHA